MIVETVHPMNVDAIWPQVAGMVQGCIDRFGNDASAGDLWTMCRAGHVFMIVAFDDEKIKAVTIWRSETWVDGVVLRNLMTAGEDMLLWIEDITRAARELATSCGASSFVWQGREAWKRYFKGRAMSSQTLYRMKV